MLKTSDKTANLKQSAIRSATVRCLDMNGVNLGQGTCDIPTPDKIKKAAFAAIEHDHNTYSAHEGVLELRQAISDKLWRFNKIKADAVKEVIVTHGAIGAYTAAAHTLFNPGDEVLLFEPFYSYHKNILEMTGVKVVPVSISLKDLSIDLDQVKKAITKHTRGIVVCTPHNPTGKVFSKEELLAIGELAEKHDLAIITDEIYEYITYPGHKHFSIASVDALSKRTVNISGFSKTYNMTGWRLGYASGPAHIMEKMALLHDLFYICAVTPLQYAVITALGMEENYYDTMRKTYLNKRDDMAKVFRELGFEVTVPQGSYYMMANFKTLGFADDVAAMDAILEKAKVATVAGRAFYVNPVDGKHVLRVCYALTEDKLELAATQLQSLKKLSRATA